MTIMLLPLPILGGVKDAELPLGSRQLVEVVQALWIELFRTGERTDDLQDLIDIKLIEIAGRDGLAVKQLYEHLGSMRLAVDLIQTTLDKYLGPFNDPAIFEKEPSISFHNGDVLIRFKIKGNDQKNSQDATDAADTAAGGSQSTD